MHPTIEELLDRRVACYMALAAAKVNAESAEAFAKRVEESRVEAQGLVSLLTLRYKALSEAIRQEQGVDLPFLMKMEVNDDR